MSFEYPNVAASEKSDPIENCSVKRTYKKRREDPRRIKRSSKTIMENEEEELEANQKEGSQFFIIKREQLLLLFQKFFHVVPKLAVRSVSQPMQPISMSSLTAPFVICESTGQDKRKFQIRSNMWERFVWSFRIYWTRQHCRSKRNYFSRHSYCSVWPVIGARYQAQEDSLFQGVSRYSHLDIAVDGQYDSPGHCANLCSVACIDNKSKMVLTISTVQKDETAGVSNRMELEGVKRCLTKLEDAGLNIHSLTSDRHVQLRSFLQKDKPHIQHFFDGWHTLKPIRRTLHTKSKKKFNSELRLIGPRLMRHLYHCSSLSKSDPAIIKETAFSALLHLCGIHEWKAGKVADVVSRETAHLYSNKNKSKRTVDPRAIIGSFQVAILFKQSVDIFKSAILEEEFTKVLCCAHPMADILWRNKKLF
uniref:Transposase n=1 Tax=Ditylenchus dipsaci TaxID=166011 RepID=A0A915D506_9BILA